MLRCRNIARRFRRRNGRSPRANCSDISAESATIVPTRRDDPEIGNTKHFDDPIAAGLKFFANDPLVAQPGTHFHYSTQGYTLVGCAIEGASGEKYVAFMHDHVFRPRGNDRTRWRTISTRQFPTARVSITRELSGRVVAADPLDSSYKVPGGGWLSSADDMARFEVAILNDRLVRRATRDLMWTPQKPTDGSADYYGLGWGVGRNTPGFPMWAMAEASKGTSTFILIDSRRARWSRCADQHG